MTAVARLLAAAAAATTLNTAVPAHTGASAPAHTGANARTILHLTFQFTAPRADRHAPADYGFTRSCRPAHPISFSLIYNVAPLSTVTFTSSPAWQPISDPYLYDCQIGITITTKALPNAWFQIESPVITNSTKSNWWYAILSPAPQVNYFSVDFRPPNTGRYPSLQYIDLEQEN